MQTERTVHKELGWTDAAAAWNYLGNKILCCLVVYCFDDLTDAQTEFSPYWNLLTGLWAHSGTWQVRSCSCWWKCVASRCAKGVQLLIPPKTFSQRLEKKGGVFWSEVCLHGDQKGKVSKKATLKEGRPVVRVDFHPVYAACTWRCAPYVASVCYNLHAGASA